MATVRPFQVHHDETHGIEWVRYRDAFDRAVAKHGKNIARIIVSRMLLRSIFKMLKDKVRFNQVAAA